MFLLHVAHVSIFQQPFAVLQGFLTFAILFGSC